MKRAYLLAIILFLIVLIFYLITLQPSLAWGDGLRLQREAITAESYILAEIVDVTFAPDPYPYSRVGVAAWDHPLYVMLGNTVVCAFPQEITHCWFSSPLPAMHALWLVNLISAVFGAGTIALLFLLCYRHTRSSSASILAALFLAVSHTFWWHAVTPEVYTLFSFLLLLSVYWFDTYEQNGRFIYLAAATLVLGLGIANHLMAALAIPALIIYLYLSRKSRSSTKLNFAQVLWLIIAFMLGLMPYWLQFLRMLRTFPVSELLGPAAGTAFLQGSVALSPMGLTQSLISYLIFIFYQFLPVGVVLGLYGWWSGRLTYLALWYKAVSLYLVYLIFGLVYQVSDQFAFFLGAHLFWAVAIAMGIGHLETKLSPTLQRLLIVFLALFVLVQPLLYHLTPGLLQKAGISQEDFGIPQIGTGQRDGLAYYLNPSKRGDVTAETFGQGTLENLPEDALVIAHYYTDTDEYFVLRYYIAVHGRHPETTIVGWTTEDPFNLDPDGVYGVIEAALAVRPVYLASLSEKYYAASSLLDEYCIVEEGSLYRLLERTALVQQTCLLPTTDLLEP